MNKKLITLAVAAALAAPAAAMAEATIYGTIAGQITYEDVTNAIPPSFETTSVVVNADVASAPIGVDSNGNPVYAPGAVLPVTVTGIQLDANGMPIRVPNSGQDYKGWTINQSTYGPDRYLRGENPANRFGLKGSEDLGNGLKAIYQVEIGIDFGDANIPGGNNSSFSVRNSFVGLAGGFGTALVGRHDTPLKISTGKLDLFSDTIADYNGTVGFSDLRVDNTIAYISPSFSGFSFMGAMVAPGGGTAGSGLNINSDSIAGAYSLAAIYNNGPFYASAAYESLSNEMFMDSATSMAGPQQCFLADGITPTPTCDFVRDDYNKWRFGLGLLDWNGFTLTAIYENQDNNPEGQTRFTQTFINADGEVVGGALSPNGVDGQQLWQVQAGYAFGNNMFKAMYGAVDRNDTRILGATRDETLAINNLSGLRSALSNDIAGDKSTWAVGFDHNFSKRTKAYVIYTAVDDDNKDNLTGNTADWSGFSVGMTHKF
jgi:predicted porin